MKKTIAILAALVILAAGFYVFYARVLPHPETAPKDYFEQYEKQKLTPEVEMQLRGVQEHFLNPFVVDFEMYGDMPPGLYRYPIAFTTYALACVAKIDPSYKTFCSHYAVTIWIN